MIKKIPNLKFVIRNCNRGMSYIELIVVLSIFAVMSSIVIFNYGAFQAKVDIKNLASDMALQIISAQKAALSGLIPVQTPTVSPWKPAYGVYFYPNSDPKSFIYLVDLNQDGYFTGGQCTGDCLNVISITKGNSISRLDVFYQGDSIAHPLLNLTAIFTRPNSGPVFRSSTTFTSAINYVQITVLSPKGATALIKLYPSGRVQIN